MQTFDGYEPDAPLRAFAVTTALSALPPALAASVLFLSCDTPTSPGRDLDLPGRVDDPLALVGAHVVPMDREVVLRDRTVVIRDGRVVEVAASGWDYVKIYQNLSLAVYREVVSHARQEGIPAVGHVPTDVPLAELDALSVPVAVVVGGEWFGSDRLRAAAVTREDDGGEDR